MAGRVKVSQGYEFRSRRLVSVPPVAGRAASRFRSFFKSGAKGRAVDGGAVDGAVGTAFAGDIESLCGAGTSGDLRPTAAA